MLVENVAELIGNTPTLRTKNFEKANDIKAKIFAKLEYLNPGGSVKDRVGLSMIKTAIQAGNLKKGGTIIEATSGNTGIALAFIASSMGYKCILVMPDSMSVERQKTLKAYGAELVLTPGALGMKGSIDKAHELHKEIENSFMPLQFENPSNPQAHRMTTAVEILSDVPNIDMFVCCVGTGGTLTGTAEAIKNVKPNVEVVAVEPFESAVISGEPAGPHGIQGIGAGFIPTVLNTDIIDTVFKVKTEDAKKVMKEFALNEGVLVGISSGAALYAAMELGKLPENKDKNIAVILPDTGLRYLSSDIFE